MTAVMEYPIVSEHHSIQAFYVSMRERGEAHTMAEMLALRSAPRGLTDVELFQDVGTLEKQFRGDEAMLDTVVKEARKSGYNPGRNDFYNASIANRIGDPLGFIPPTGGRSHMKKVAEMRGHGLHGAVEVAPREAREPVKKVPLARDLIDANYNRMVKRDPSIALKPRREVEAQIIAKHGPQKASK